MADPYTNPVYCTDSDFEPICGNIAGLISAAEQGMTIRLAYDFGSSSYFLSSVFRLEVESESCELVGQIPWKIGKKASTGRYSNPYYWYITLIDTTATRTVTRWYIGKHSLKSESVSTLPYTYWFVEACWTLVYMHNADGEPLTGSKEALTKLILQGRRVKLVFGSYIMEADNVLIDNGNVAAQLLSQIDTPSPSTFTQGIAEWKWVRICSDGTFNVDLYDIGSSQKKGQSISTAQASWVVESRVWRLALSTDVNGNEILGSKSDLKQAVNTGSRLRCAIYVNSTLTLVVTADNIEINIGDSIAAQVFRLISFDNNGDSNFIPFWRILLITTNGEMKETRWTVGEHEHRGDVVSHVKTDWFVD